MDGDGHVGWHQVLLHTSQAAILGGSRTGFQDVFTNDVCHAATCLFTSRRLTFWCDSTLHVPYAG